MSRALRRFLILGLIVVLTQQAFCGVSDGYLNSNVIAGEAKSIADQFKWDYTNLSNTPGGVELGVIATGEPQSGKPAILVIANPTGDCPLSSQAALKLARILGAEWAEELAAANWYIIPVANPDGHNRFFSKPLTRSSLNARPVNDDMDDATDEDGPDDLNSDGMITYMRQEHPEGTWMTIEGNPVMMKRADAAKGEKGVYRLFIEGIDNDGDGKINEDGGGGVNPGMNFPHGFEYYSGESGMWPASEVESRAVMRFAYDHPEIAMVLVFGRTNSLKNVPESSQKAKAGQDSYKLPKRFAEHLGLDPEQEFELSELVEMGREFTGMKDLTEDMVLQFLGVGAAVNPDPNDLQYWNEISKQYNDFIKEIGFDRDRLSPSEFPAGSVEEWAYYQYGAPTFAIDFWTLPLPKKEKEEDKTEGAISPDDLEKMTNEEFIALGEEKINEFLKASGAPAQFNAQMVIMGLQGGMMTTKRMADMMRNMQKKEEAGGADETDEAILAFDSTRFVQWQPSEHPTLGTIEIGGKVPWAELAPPFAIADSLVDAQLPFIRKLAGYLPKVIIEKTEAEEVSTGVYRIKAWIANTGLLPFPTFQGARCRRPAPMVAELGDKSLSLIEGKHRTPVGVLTGSGGSERLSWLISAPAGSTVQLNVTSASAGTASATIKLGGNQ